MSQRNYEERTRREKPAPEQEEYDLYLFWPSLSNRDLSSGDPLSSPLYGVRFYSLPSLSGLPTVFMHSLSRSIRSRPTTTPLLWVLSLLYALPLHYV